MLNIVNNISICYAKKLLDQQIRQYAAILLKERYSKVKNWGKLPVDVRTRAKQLIVQVKKIKFAPTISNNYQDYKNN